MRKLRKSPLLQVRPDFPWEFLQGFVRNENFQGYLNCPKGGNPPHLLDYAGIYILYETELGIQK